MSICSTQLVQEQYSNLTPHACIEYQDLSDTQELISISKEELVKTLDCHHIVTVSDFDFQNHTLFEATESLRY